MHIMFMYAYIIFCRCKSMTMRSERNLFHHHSWRARFSLARHYNLTTIFMFKVAVHFELSYCISFYIFIGCSKEPRVTCRVGLANRIVQYLTIRPVLYPFQKLSAIAPFSSRCASTDLRSVLAEKIPQEQERVKQFRKDFGNVKVGEVTVDMVSTQLVARPPTRNPRNSFRDNHHRPTR